MNNPVMARELRGRMRGIKAFAVLSTFLLFLSFLAVLIYLLTATSLSRGAGPQSVAAGKVVFSGLFLFELFLVSFLTPAFTAGVFSGERERRTYDLLLTTSLSAGEMVWGKLISALAYLVALIVASVPLLGSAFMMGGVAPEEVAIGFWILLLATVLFGSVGVFFSSFLGSTVASTVLSYAVVLILTVGIPVLAIVSSPFLGLVFGRIGDPKWLESLALIYAGGLAICTNPFLVAGITEGLYATGKSLFFFTETIGNTKVLLVSPWLVFSAIYVVASAFLILGAARLVGRRR